MKLINIYLVGLIYVLKPTKYMVWNNEIISWRLGLLCMAAFWLATFLENGFELGLIRECCGSYWGMYLAMLNYYEKLINEIN